MIEKPELVLITGDIIDSSTIELTDLIRQLNRLNADYGVWAVRSNQDYYSHGDLQSILLTKLNAIGIIALANQRAKIRHDIYLVGTDDLYNDKPDIDLALKAQRHALFFI